LSPVLQPINEHTVLYSHPTTARATTSASADAFMRIAIIVV